MSPKPAATPSKTFQIKITLEGSKPPIWRRVLVGDNLTLAAFHQLIQVVMGWTNSHLHMFEIYGQIYGDPEDDETGMMETKDERKHRLGQFDEGDKFIYEYDFGDGWRHKILIEKVLPLTPDAKIPLCIKGKGCCPPEDIGGVWGYADFLDAIADPDNPKRDEMLEWIGEDFDPAYFNLDAINAALKSFK